MGQHLSPTSSTLKREAGRWYVCFSVACEHFSLPENHESVGIDVGLESFAPPYRRGPASTIPAPSRRRKRNSDVLNAAWRGGRRAATGVVKPCKRGNGRTRLGGHWHHRAACGLSVPRDHTSALWILSRGHWLQASTWPSGANAA